MDEKIIFKSNAEFAKKLAAEGIVLLKNEDGVLPLSPGDRITPVGKGCFSLTMVGGGAADVKTAYVKSVYDGLCEKVSEKKFQIYCPENREYSSRPFPNEYIGEISSKVKTVVVSLVRYAEEGVDCKAIPGEYYLSAEEEELFANMLRTGIKNVIIVLNISNVMDLSWIKKYPNIKAVLLAWMPGMEGGSAVADILSGDVCPSGKLTDTFAGVYENYPSCESFNAYDCLVKYYEDIFVGYRYFETLPGKSETVTFPFGFGLSYTTFEISAAKVSCSGGAVSVAVSVKNTGKTAGKEVVQIYSHAPEGKLQKPAKALVAFMKTKLLKPGETQKLKISFQKSDLASFDDSGITGHLGAFVLEEGAFEILVGTSVRDTFKAGEIKIAKTTVTSLHHLLLTPTVPERFTASGVPSAYAIGTQPEPFSAPVVGTAPKKRAMLADVAAGKLSLQSFIAQLSPEQMVHLAHGQPASIGEGTGGIGNISEYGIPNIQTADGPSGFRREISTTCFPCSTLVACTWNPEMQYELGAALAKESAIAGVDVLLAPGLNIHRDPLAGRNFEYYSEDPLVAGKSAAAIVRGAQENGLPSTLKHFAGNDKEYCRKESSSLISERALREIYLKGFEIGVKESNPCCIMTSYNLINGTYPSENANLLKDILRGEWGFSGMVMTDWWNLAKMWREIKAGNNLRMPIAEYGAAELVLKKYAEGVITRAELENNTRLVLELIMKTRTLRNHLNKIKELG